MNYEISETPFTVYVRIRKSLNKIAPKPIKKETKVNAKNIKEIDDKNSLRKQLDNSKQEIKAIIDTTVAKSMAAKAKLEL